MPEAVGTVVGDHYGLYGRSLQLDLDLVNDLGSDDIDKVEVMMTLEELFGCRFGATLDPNAVSTVGDLVSLVEAADYDGKLASVQVDDLPQSLSS